MSAENVKPAYNAKRRIQFLFGFVILALIVASAGWFFVAGRISSIAEEIIVQQAAEGVVVDCDRLEVRGYPFRFGLFCDSLDLETPQQVRFAAGAFRSAAQFYAPRDLIIELDSPANLDLAGGSVQMNWSLMRSRVLATEPLPESISVTGLDVSLARSGSSSQVDTASVEAFMRIVGNDLDLAARLSEFSLAGTGTNLDELPPLGADFDLRVMDGAALLLSGAQSLRGSEVELKRLAILLDPDSGMIVSGPLSIAENGLIDGTLTVRVIDVDAVSSVLVAALPDAKDLITAFATGQPRVGDSQDEIEFELLIANGQMRLGLIPIAAIPPL